MTHEISVVICTYSEKRWNDLVAAVESVQRQLLPAKEILVVIDHNPALLIKAEEQLSGTIVLENTQAKGASGSRNTASEAAQGEILAFLDDDAIAQPDWLQHLLAAYTAQSIVGVGGRIDPLWSAGRPFWFPAEFHWVVGCTYKGMPTTNASVRNVIGANMSVRRDILRAVGGFRESFGNTKDDCSACASTPWFRHRAGDEETEFCIRVTQHDPTGVWLYTTSAVVQHRIPLQRTHLSYFLWRCYDEGLGKASLVHLYNRQIGLSSERDYTLKVLPGGIAQNLRASFTRFDIKNAFCAAAIVLGLLATLTGYFVGNIFLRVSRKQFPEPHSSDPAYLVETPARINAQE